VSDWIDEIVCSFSQNPPADFCSSPSTDWINQKAIALMGLTIIPVVIACIVFRIWTQSTNKVSDAEKEALGKPYNRNDSESDSYGSIEAAPLHAVDG